VLSADHILELSVLRREGFVKRGSEHSDGLTPYFDRARMCGPVDAFGESTHDDDSCIDKESCELRGASKANLEKLRQIAERERCGDGYLIEDADFRREIAQVEIDLHTLEYTELRAMTAAAKGEAPGPEANVLKIRGTELQQKISELLMRAMGYYAMPFLPKAMAYGYNEDSIGPAEAAPLAAAYFNMRKTSIYGGTNEIQKNIIAKMVLGL